MFSSRDLPGLKSMVVLLASKPLSVSLVVAEDPLTLKEPCFRRGIQEIQFLASFDQKAEFSYSLDSSSPETTFHPASTLGTIMVGGASSVGCFWLTTPGGATLGEVHTLTLAMWNENGAVTRRLRLQVAVRASGGVGGAEYANLFLSDESEPGGPSTWGVVN